MSNNEGLNAMVDNKGMEERTTVTDQIPLRILVLADFTPDKPTRDASVSVDKNNFDDVVEMFCPQLRLNVSNRIEQNPKEMAVDLIFNKLDSFRPEEIVSQVSIFSELMEIQRLLAAFGDQGLSCHEFQDCIENIKGTSTILSLLRKVITSSISISSVSPTSEPAIKTEPLDSLFEMVDIPVDTTSQQHGTAPVIGNFIARIVQSQGAEIT
ncbi:MAG: type VI secretion system contractile sheath small subunit, partial [Candidatus Desantisbacteria bacterium]